MTEGESKCNIIIQGTQVEVIKQFEASEKCKLIKCQGLHAPQFLSQ